MRDVVIVSGVRTPFGRALKGLMKDTRPDVMGAHVIKEALARAKGIQASEIEDVIMGCAMPEAEQGMNVARIASLEAGLPVEVPAATVNRFCASGLQSIADVAARIATGDITTGIAGGLETMSMIPMGGNKVSLNKTLVESHPEVFTPMGTTAENIARKFEVSRADQDAFALRSHQRAVAAMEKGIFREEIAPLPTRVFDANGKSQQITVEKDEYPRPDSSAEALGKLKPAFDQTGTVTAGNSSPLTDGAAAVVLTTAEHAKEVGATPLGYFRGFAVAGVPPEIMGIGPVPAIRKLLAKTGKKIEDIDLFEINEAFAAQALYCARELKIDQEKLNVNGGAIALGHPLGVSGTRLVITALNELKRRKGKLAVVSMCIGGGMGAAALLERVE